MKKYKFRLQVVLDMRERELEARQMEMAKIVTALNQQQEKLQSILTAQDTNTRDLEALSSASELNIGEMSKKGFWYKACKRR